MTEYKEEMKFKLTSDIRSENASFGKYEQYIDLREAYNQKEKAGLVEVGVTTNNDYKIVPGINVICGMTGHGKSMLANNIAYRAIKRGLNVAYISLEISKENMFYQMISIKSFDNGATGDKLISHSTLKARNLLPEQEKYVFDELWPSFKDMPGNIYVVGEWDFNTTSSREMQIKLMEVENYARTHSGHGIDLLIVDYIQLFKQYTDTYAQGEYSVLGMWVNDFRKMSQNYLGLGKEIPIVLLSQLNRDAWNDDKSRLKAQSRGKNTPDVILSISQVAGCTEIVKSADQVFAVYSDESLKASKQCLISVIKCRNGETRVEPVISFMDPKYYIMGVESNHDNCELDSLDELMLGSDMTELNLANLQSGNI